MSFKISRQQYEALLPRGVPPKPEELFDFEIAKLIEVGLLERQGADLFRSIELTNDLFLVVPAPPKVLDLNHLASLIVVDGQKGTTRLSATQIKDVIEVPQGPYLMSGIEDGRERLNVRPAISQANIMKEGRLPYNLWQGIIHAIVFPLVLKHHFLDLVGSQLATSEGFPNIWAFFRSDFQFSGQPYIDAPRIIASPKWGAPSYGKIIVP